MKLSSLAGSLLCIAVAASVASCSGDKGKDGDASGTDTIEEAGGDTPLPADTGENGGDTIRGDNAEEDVAEGDTGVDAIPEDGVEPETLEDVEVQPPVHPLFAGPEGILVKDGLVYVTNTNGAWDDAQGAMIYGPGYVTVLNASDLSYAGQVEFGFMNPQIVIDLEDGGDRIAVICSGTNTMDENWTMTPAASGAVIVLDSKTLVDLGSVEIVSGVPTPLAGFPGAAVYEPGTQSVWVGSGTASYIYRVEVGEEGLGTAPKAIEIYPDEGMNDSIIPAYSAGHIYAASFNNGSLNRVDPVNARLDLEPFDVTETDELEGPLDIKVYGDTLYILLTISSKVAALVPETGDISYPFATGAIPNRLAIWDDRMYCVNSGDNNLSLFELDSEMATQAFAVFDPGTNPWEMAVADGFGYVTGYMSNTVVKVDLETGDVVASTGNPE